MRSILPNQRPTSRLATDERDRLTPEIAASALIRLAPSPMALIDGCGRLLAYSSTWLLNALSLPKDVAAHRSGLEKSGFEALQACLDTGQAQLIIHRDEQSFRIDLCRDTSGAEPLIWATAIDVTVEQAALAISLRQQRSLELALQIDETLVRESDLVTGAVKTYGVSSDFIREHALRPEMKNDWSWIDPRDKHAVLQELHASMTERRIFHLSYRMNRDDGVETHLSSIGEITCSPTGEPLSVLSVIKDVTVEVQARRRIETLAYRDPLTGLANRALFQSELGAVSDRSDGQTRSFGLVMIDVDHFKTINDTLGHDAGDVLLRAVGDALTQAFNEAAVVARLGGDEFAVILKEVLSHDDLIGPINAVQQALREPFRHMGQAVHIGLSMGALLCEANETFSGAEALKKADIALYRAKALGRDRLVMFAAEMQSEADERLATLREVQAGIIRGEFLMHYQPIVDLATNRICGFEALMRWEHPQRGLLPPAAFNAALEDPDLSLQLGEVALDGTLRQMRSWLDQNLEFGRVAINVAASQFKSGKLVEDVEARLRRWGVPAGRLTIEITENIYLGAGSSVVASTVQALHDMGVLIALDDFGTGYASLTNLRQLPIDRLKIDKSFVQDTDTSVVRAMIGLGSDLGMRVVAEGVETSEQLSSLRSQGCDHVQGYIFGHPADSSQTTTLLQRENCLPS